MKHLLHILPLVALLAVLSLSGCTIETEVPPTPDYRPAGTLVVNEVFALPLTSPATYCWIEFLNPTRDTVDLTNWTLEYTTFRGVMFYRFEGDSTGYTLTFRSNFPIIDSLGRHRVPFGEGIFQIPGLVGGGSAPQIPPNGLFTIVNIDARLRDHTSYGPADDRFIERNKIFFMGGLLSLDTVEVSDTNTVIEATNYAYGFFLNTTEELVLRDAAGNVVDVVRYGGYRYTGPGPDPYPGNESLGPIPEFESLFRYAGGYKTGNTAADFFITTPTIRPIPHWYSQLYKF